MTRAYFLYEAWEGVVSESPWRSTDWYWYIHKMCTHIHLTKTDINLWLAGTLLEKEKGWNPNWVGRSAISICIIAVGRNNYGDHLMSCENHAYINHLYGASGAFSEMRLEVSLLRLAAQGRTATSRSQRRRSLGWRVVGGTVAVFGGLSGYHYLKADATERRKMRVGAEGVVRFLR